MRPPKGFTPVKDLQAANIVRAPGFASGMVRGQYQAMGIRYEQQIVTRLDATLPEHWVGWPGFWFNFVDKTGDRYAQPDWIGLNMRDFTICIVEVKLSSVEKAWWQINKLYKPLVQYVFPDWPISGVMVVSKIKRREFPEQCQIIHDITKAQPDKTYMMHVPYGRS